VRTQVQPPALVVLSHVAELSVLMDGRKADRKVAQSGGT